MDASECLCTLSHSKRFEFTNGVVTAKRGPCMTQSAHVASAEELSAAFRQASNRVGASAARPRRWSWQAQANASIAYATTRTGHPGGTGVAACSPRRRSPWRFVSPDQSVADLREECRLYLAHGVDVCWLINPDQRWAEVFDRVHDGSRVEPGGALETALVPGLSIPLQSPWNAVEAVSE